MSNDGIRTSAQLGGGAPQTITSPAGSPPTAPTPHALDLDSSLPRYRPLDPPDGTSATPVFGGLSPVALEHCLEEEALENSANDLVLDDMLCGVTGKQPKVLGITPMSTNCASLKARERSIGELVGVAEAAASAAAAAAKEVRARASGSWREQEQEEKARLGNGETVYCYWVSKYEQADRERSEIKARWSEAQQELDRTRRTVLQLQQQLQAARARGATVT